MNTSVKALFTHFFTLVFFIIVALAYFYPVLQGKAIYQSDIQQYNGMAREQTAFREATGDEPYWTNSAFGGMPTYQLGANYPHHYVKDLDRIIRFLPRPADYLFLYFIGFYILLCCLKVDYRLAVLGALAFGFSTYFIIILGVGHNAKAHALGYLPLLLAGILLVFRKNYLWGFLLTSLAMALEVAANHYQMTYYFMLLVLVLGLVFLIDAIRNKSLSHFFRSVGVLLIAVILGIGVNATSLLATKEYADWSTRGNSELTVNPDGSNKESTKGLSKDYITQYSYGITESLNLMVPRLYGGASSEDLGKNSRTYDYLTDQGISRSRALEFTSALPLYWGDQPGTAGPAYLGAIVVFLFLLALFLVKGKYKWWLLAGSVFTLMLSWGKNFPLLTDFMIDYFPLYNKFRAVSSIQVIVELCIPLLMVLGLVKFFDQSVEKGEKMNALKLSAIASAAILVALLILQGLFSFSGANDGTYERFFGEEILAMIISDREMVYQDDTLRSLLFVSLAALCMWLYLKERISETISIAILALLITADLVVVDRRYVNEEQFVRQRVVKEPFQAAAIDKQILSDTTYYRVYDPSEGLNGARTSNFYQSIGGYHAAKPAGMQDLFDYHIYTGGKDVLNMLNVKYIMQQDEEGRRSAGLNPETCGSAWFITELKKVNNADEELLGLNSFDPCNEAFINTTRFPEINRFNFTKDPLATIELSRYEPNHLTYQYNTSEDAVLVFSEIYYENGWNAYLDGVYHPHFKVNYVLRAAEVPAGKHKIEFRFEPEVIQIGNQITIGSSIALLLVFLGGIVYSIRRNRVKETQDD